MKPWELLGEARLTYRLRDERGVYSDIWASGIMRRAALAVLARCVGSLRCRDGEFSVRIGNPQRAFSYLSGSWCSLEGQPDAHSKEA